jgi:hypothetical protein
MNRMTNASGESPGGMGANGRALQRSSSATSLENVVASTKSTNGLTSFLEAAPKTKMSRGSATVGAGSDEGEIIIRADGKKVRKIRKSVTRVKTTDDNYASQKGLGSFLDQGSASKAFAHGSATVSGVPTIRKAKSADEGEIYTREDGKRVRRIAKKPSEASSNKSLSGFLNILTGSSKSKRSGSNTVAGDQVTKKAEMGEIIIRADGTKVRRIKKIKKSDEGGRSSNPELKSFLSKDRSDTNGLQSLSGSATVTGVSTAKVSELALAGDVDTNERGKNVQNVKTTPSTSLATNRLDGFLHRGFQNKTKASGSATVAGDTPTKSSTFMDGEIYINKDGKKVRRIKRIKSSSSTDGVDNHKVLSLSGLLDTDSATKPRPLGPATVCGERNVVDQEEIVIRADGKKVRRVKRTTSSESIEADSAKKNLSKFLEISGDRASTQSAQSGSATVTGVPVNASFATSVGDVYINEHGKKVRRVKKKPASSASSGLSGFLDDSVGASRKKPSGSATVAGDNPTKAKSYAEGEIYINKDGKKVRRVKRSPGGAATDDILTVVQKTNSLSGFLNENEVGTYSKLRGSATVAGERVVKSTIDGDVIIRDGKKILRRKKNGYVASAKSEDTDVYRRADGKLVRRVKKSGTHKLSGDLAGFLGSEEQKIAETQDSSATVVDSGIKPDFSRLLQSKRIEKEGYGSDTPAANEDVILSKSSVSIVRPSLEQPSNRSKCELSTTVDLSEAEELIASPYRKMLEIDLPESAVERKLIQDGVDNRICVTVLGRELSTSTQKCNSDRDLPNGSAADLGLHSAEHGIDDRLLKLEKTTKPDQAVEGVDINDLSEFCGEQSTFTVSPVVSGKPSHLSDSTLGVTHPFEVLEEASTTKPVATTSAVEFSLPNEEEFIAARFRKMILMGLPEAAVRQKMEMESIDPKKILHVLYQGDSASSSSIEACTRLHTEPLHTSSSQLPRLTDEEREVMMKYRKMVEAGLPEAAVSQKLLNDGADPKLIAYLAGEEKPACATPTKATDACVHVPNAAVSTFPFLPRLAPEERELVHKYKKMLSMGLPEDAVIHKLMQDGVDPKLVAYLNGEENPELTSTAVAVDDVPNGEIEASDTKTMENATYVVLETKPQGLTSSSEKNSTLGVSLTTGGPDEKFTVKMDDSTQNLSSEEAEMKHMTLDELAMISGQSRNELEAVIAQKRTQNSVPPRFVLQSVDMEQPESVYEVAVPLIKRPAGAAKTGQAQSDKGAPVGDGQEVVDSDLAKAARAVSALGDLDMKSLLEKLQTGDVGDLIAKLKEAERWKKKVEKQLAQAGVAIAEDIEYGEAKNKVEEIAKRMNEIGGSDVQVADKEEQNRLREEYFKLEQDMERYNTALMVSEEYQAEQERLEREWEESNLTANLEALKKVRRHMPVMIRNMSEAELTNTPTPNGKFLPNAIAKKFKRTNILQCLRLNPDDIERMHPATVEGFRVTGLTLTERRALYLHLKPIGPKWEKNKAEKMTERKWTWFKMMKNNFKENLAPYQRHVDQYGPPGSHPYATRENPDTGCPLIGKQCPLKADKVIDYDGDYGFTEEDEYEHSDVRKADTDDPGAKAMQEALELAREKKANERAELLKKHYKGKLLQVSKANGSCEAMDESMDKMENHTIRWIEFILDKGENIIEADHAKELANFTEALNEHKLAFLDFAQRSGMQMSGKRKAGGDSPDIRSFIECGLSEEVIECSRELFSFIKDRMKEIKARDTRIEKTVELLENVLTELHERNLATLESLQVKRPERSRKLRINSELKKEAQEKMKPKEEEIPPDEPVLSAGPSSITSGGGRGGLLDALSGRGRGDGGRGNLLGAISGRGRGRGGRGDLLGAISGRGRGGGGRGDLLGAISGRGRGGGGGRGGLLAAIQSKTEGGPPSADGGRGGLLSAIQGRGGGGGRGGLLAAIAARGGGDD